MSDLSWYWASSPKATFGFEVADGKVVAVAPYGRRWLLGVPLWLAVTLLSRRGYEVRRGDR